MGKSIALFGTSADPPTIGHKKILEELSKIYAFTISYVSRQIELFDLLKSNLKSVRILISFISLSFCVLGSSVYGAEDRSKDMKMVYELLQEKKFDEGIQQLQALSENNNINAQLLISKIFLTGDLTPQDFQNSYFWASLALLGGLKKSEKILEKLSNYLTEKQINEIKPIFQLLKFNILFKVYLFFFSFESNMSLTKRLSVSILTPSEISILILSSPSLALTTAPYRPPIVKILSPRFSDDCIFLRSFSFFWLGLIKKK